VELFALAADLPEQMGGGKGFPDGDFVHGTSFHDFERTISHDESFEKPPFCHPRESTNTEDFERTGFLRLF
jgi:hypothetical protein